MCWKSFLRPNGVRYFYRELELELEKEGQTCWWQHPGYVDDRGSTHMIDIAVVPLNDTLEALGVDRKTIQSFDNKVIVHKGVSPDDMTYEEASVRVGADVFILGYPKGLASQGPFPVWKRASVATEPLFNLEGGHPIVLLDGLTRHGMSGSPVIYLGSDLRDSRGFPADLNGNDLDDPWLLGVYAGRRGSSGDELEMALGRMWRKEHLDEIFRLKTPGRTTLSAIAEEPEAEV
jgi:hypothetical protein